MHAKIQKWGNSQGVRLTRSVLDDACLGVGDEVDVVVRDGLIIVAPIRTIRKRYRIEDLVAHIAEDDRPGELDWGGSAGKEAW